MTFGFVRLPGALLHRNGGLSFADETSLEKAKTMNSSRSKRRANPNRWRSIEKYLPLGVGREKNNVFAMEPETAFRVPFCSNLL